MSEAKRKLAPSLLTGERKSVPLTMSRKFQYRDLRKEQVDALDKANPEFVHMYQDPRVLTEEGFMMQLDAKGQEIVKDKEGRILHHNGDPVVRMKKEEFVNERLQEEGMSEAIIKENVKNPRPTVKRQPKEAMEVVEK